MFAMDVALCKKEKNLISFLGQGELGCKN